MFFDERELPWPKHDCDTSWLRVIVRIIEPDGSIRVDSTEDISAIRPGSFVSQLTITDPYPQEFG